MLVSELMEYPKIRALMEKYWQNDKDSGVWGTNSMTEELASAFIWNLTDEGHDFWEYLSCLDLGECKDKYPEYFVKEEVNKVDIEYLKEWPKLHARAEHILSSVGEVHSLEEAASLFYDNGFSPASNIWDWEGTNFWSLIDLGAFTIARKKLPQLFEKGESYVPEPSSNEPTNGTKSVGVTGLTHNVLTSLKKEVVSNTNGGSGSLKTACEAVLGFSRNSPELQYDPEDVSFKVKESVKKVLKAKDLIYHILSTP